MATARLSELDKEFYNRLIRESDDVLRAMAVKACAYAVGKSSVKYPVILAALKTMKEGKPLSAAQKSEMGKLVATLDAVRITTDIRSRDKTGKTDTLSARTALFQARAANAVFMATNPDPLFAALEAVYEAYLATGDWPALKAALIQK
jgi:ribonucleotide monophosphatase NagD (HAD superfamily)